MNTKEVLIAAKALIDTPEKWTKGWYFKTADGKPIGRSKAACFCSIGAIDFACNGKLKQYDSAYAILYAAIDQRWKTVAGWNDAPERTHAEVMAAFDRAIEAAS